MPDITLEQGEGIALLLLNRPERLNALSMEMLDELAQRCREIERLPDIHVVILSGSGKAFCAGGDIDAWSAHTAEDFSRLWLRDGHDAFDRLARLRQPVIAALNGHALGGGLELAACADYRLAEAHVRIGQPEATLGIISGWSGTQRATRRFGAQLVRRMALFGEMFTAEQSLHHGIVDQVVESGQALQEARKLAHTLRHRAPVAMELTKMLINAAEGEERERILEAMAGRIAALNPELQQGIDAFRRREKPDFWQGIEQE